MLNHVLIQLYKVFLLASWRRTKVQMYSAVANKEKVAFKTAGFVSLHIEV